MKKIFYIVFIFILSACTQEPSEYQIREMAETIVWQKERCSELNKLLNNKNEVISRNDIDGRSCDVSRKGRMPSRFSMEMIRGIMLYEEIKQNE